MCVSVVSPKPASLSGHQLCHQHLYTRLIPGGRRAWWRTCHHPLTQTPGCVGACVWACMRTCVSVLGVSGNMHTVLLVNEEMSCDKMCHLIVIAEEDLQCLHEYACRWSKNCVIFIWESKKPCYSVLRWMNDCVEQDDVPSTAAMQLELPVYQLVNPPSCWEFQFFFFL